MKKKLLKIFIKEDCKECTNIKMKVTRVKAEPYMDTLAVKYVDVDKSEAEALAYEVQSVPTLILFRGDDVIWRRTGSLTYHDLRYNVES